MNQRYGKEEKLKQKKQIETLFTDGNSLGQYPIRLFYLRVTSENIHQPTRTGVSVSKRNFKNAVDRNKIKRLLREAYKKNKYLVNDLNSHPYWLMIVYVGKEIPELKPLDVAVMKAFKKLKKIKK